jgi:hypothetical protein
MATNLSISLTSAKIFFHSLFNLPLLDFKDRLSSILSVQYVKIFALPLKPIVCSHKVLANFKQVHNKKFTGFQFFEILICL